MCTLTGASSVCPESAVLTALGDVEGVAVAGGSPPEAMQTLSRAFEELIVAEVGVAGGPAD